MAPPRRIGAENSATRGLILDATEQIMLEEGYAAASSRRVAAKAGLKPSLVHYYFPTTDDMLIAVYRRAADWSNEMLTKALQDPDPLRALWDYTINTTRTGLALEFMALASHRKALGAQISEHATDTHARQLAVIEQALGDKVAVISPQVLSILIAGVGRMLVMENGLGISTGHDEARAWFERWLDSLSAKA